MGNNQFMYASVRAGVTLSSLQSTFWTSRFEMARKVDS